MERSPVRNIEDSILEVLDEAYVMGYEDGKAENDPQIS